jgi:hypothetical protein
MCPRERTTLIFLGGHHKASTAKTGALFVARKAGILSGCGVLRLPTGGVATLNPRLHARIPIGMQLDMLELHCRRVPPTWVLKRHLKRSVLSLRASVPL